MNTDNAKRPTGGRHRMAARPAPAFACFCHLAAALAVLLLPDPARAQYTNGQNAASVLGQLDFTTNASGSTAFSIFSTFGVAVDPTTGKIFLGDYNNNRILRFISFAAFVNGAPAEAVLGQADFTSNGAATSATGMNSPVGVTVDSVGRLWVNDYGNHRILRFDDASNAVTGAAANGVLGQTDFITGTAGLTQSKMDNPQFCVTDALGTLWVADTDNNRVLRFNNAAAKPDGANADAVLGQTDFVSATAATTQSGMDDPTGLAADTSGNLWVSDFSNHRMLRFANAATRPNGASANAVLGQPTFLTGAPSTTQSGLNSPGGLSLDPAGRLYVTDAGNHRVVIFKNAASQPNGANANLVLGQTDFITGTSGLAQNKFNDPYAAAFSNGSLWIADDGNNRALRFAATGAQPAVSPQERRITLPPRSRINRRFKIRNAGSNSDAFFVRLSPLRSGISVRFRHQGRNVTQAVRDGAFLTDEFNVGSERTLIAQIRSRSRLGRYRIELLARSATNSAIQASGFTRLTVAASP
jgi:sugar lactone lactonase YvrE